MVYKDHNLAIYSLPFFKNAGRSEIIFGRKTLVEAYQILSI